MQKRQRSRHPEWTIIKLLNWTTSYFKSRDIDNPRATAEILLSHVLKIKRIDLYLKYDQPLCHDELLEFKALIKRRVEREPVAYIVGIKEFWSMEFCMTTDALIPRPESEFLVEITLGLLKQFSNNDQDNTPKRILELGAGSGAVISAIAFHESDHTYFASDCSVKALCLAKKNTVKHGLEKKVGLFCSDWFTALKDQNAGFDLIISNPPYIPKNMIRRLEPEIYRYEPALALDGGKDGLGCLRWIINHAHHYLKNKGHLILEMGYDQKNDVGRIIDDCNQYDNVIFTKDYSGYNRIVQMRKKYVADRNLFC